MIDRGSSEEYLIWWLNNAYPFNDYDPAHHAEAGMRAAPNIARCGHYDTLFELYDIFARQWGPTLAAEAFRRALAALSTERTAGASASSD